ncbi:MAG: DUF5668 domain-containing protein [Melioribacteraceae bacterium]|nr:MAG: DUF5668 domain-containing protein [Melioribacteraceae bacterium]
MKQCNGRLLIGFSLIVVGLAFVLRNLNVFSWEFEYVFLSWPSLVFLIGLVTTISSRGSFWGFSAMIVGAIFITARYYDYPAGEIFSDIWPVFIILLGLSILFQHKKKKSIEGEKTEGWVDYADNTLDLSTVFNENKYRITSQNFRTGKTSTLFGSTELDFRDAKLEQNASLYCDTIFGGTELTIPSTWKVINKGSAIFGGSADERRKSAPVNDNEENVITINGFTLFGGIEIKS